MSFIKYSQRLLNPFRGSMNIIEYKGAEAVYYIATPIGSNEFKMYLGFIIKSVNGNRYHILRILISLVACYFNA